MYWDHLLDRISSNPRSFWSESVIFSRKRTGANSHTSKFQETRNFKFAPKSRFSEFSRYLHNKCDCLHFLRENMSLSLQKLLGFEEISSSRWSQYILKRFNSSSMKSYRPLKLGVSFWKKCQMLQNAFKTMSRDPKSCQKIVPKSTLKKYKTILSTFPNRCFGLWGQNYIRKL